MAGPIDWPGLMRVGLHGLGLAPAAFWNLTPVELRIMLGRDAVPTPLTRARLAELARAFPDNPVQQEAAYDGSGSADG